MQLNERSQHESILDLEGVLNSMIDGILIMKRRGRFETQKQKDEGHVKRKAEAGVLLPKPRNTRSHHTLEEKSKNSPYFSKSMNQRGS